MKNDIGKKLRILRKSKGLSQEQVADFLCISQSAYSRIERGETNSWALLIEQICNYYDISFEELSKIEIVEKPRIKKLILKEPFFEKLRKDHPEVF